VPVAQKVKTNRKSTDRSKSAKKILDKKMAKKDKSGEGLRKSSFRPSTHFAEIFLKYAPQDFMSNFDKTALDCVIARHEHAHKERKSGQTVIEVFNPIQSNHGWSGSHTVLNLITDDKAFIIDSVIALLTSKSYQIEFIIHPLVFVERDKSDHIKSIHTDRAEGRFGQSHIFVQLNRRLTEIEIQELRGSLAEVYEDVHLSNHDWTSMKAEVKNLANEVIDYPKILTAVKEDSADFLNYIHDNNFTLLGFSQYSLSQKTGQIAEQKTKGLGILNPKRSKKFLDKKDESSIFNVDVLNGLGFIIVTKLGQNSPVHRRVPLDAVIIKKMDDKGQMIGFSLILGLFTSVTYSRGLNTVPFLRFKADAVLAKSGLTGADHSSRALRHILEKFPRDDLFQIDTKHLYTVCMSIMQLQEQPRIAVYFSPDAFGRRITAITYIPRELYDTRLRIKFACILEDELDATYLDFQSTVDDSPLVRSSFTLTWNEKSPRKIDRNHIEKRLQEAGKSWSLKLYDALLSKMNDEDKAADKTLKYGSAFNDAYQEMYQARQSVHDIYKIEEALEHDRVEVDLYRPYNAGGKEVSLKIFSRGKPVALSDVLPILENMGLRVVAEYPFEVRPRGEEQGIWIQDFLAEVSGKIIQLPDKNSIQNIEEEFETCLKGIWAGQVENDNLNRLLFLSSMPWRDIVILRACVRYLRQTKIPFSLTYMEQALTDYPHIAALLTQLFHAKFSPEKQMSKNSVSKIHNQILDALQTVASIDQDRILRAILGVMDATLRTNFFQRDAQGNAKSWVSMKLDSSKITDIPEPRPYREITVYSPRVEGIHLRVGPIARGGLRWSDRHEDFRTEVLGLVKAQNVKNSVIVPMGAKGGFVVKNPPRDGGREAFMKEGIACYQTYIRALLDITDNRKMGKIVPPADVVRYDGDDPYLVVAADKGTATFSDIANAISLECGFWMGDAFASGGSAGYDHKKMGITARGSWESVKRHFREININTQTEEFHCIGVGDMAGDVFGNGMLQSNKIRLIGAFNHLHIFCDPNPDVAVSFAERQRLFQNVKGWDHYDVSKLSKGGRIFLRSEKVLRLTPEIQKCFGLDKSEVSPNELIKALLKADTDLLYFGGIGTYIKSSDETPQDAGDRSNDNLRVEATEIRAKVIGEGANLAITQRGRIECAKFGIRLNTDFIDNSAGVDTSDHEVNIKILLSDVAGKPKYKFDKPTRDKLLSEMTDDVAALVLNDNYKQTQAISLLERQAPALMAEHAEFMQSLERSGLLNRRVEFLPDDDQIIQRLKTGKGLTRPELSLIVSYGKMTYTKALLASKIPDNTAYIDWLLSYFPTKLQKKFGAEIMQHQLRREIIATGISNTVVNRMGPTFVRMTAEKTGASMAEVTEAYMTIWNAFELSDLWQKIESLDNQVAASLQLEAQSEISRLALHGTYWLLTQSHKASKTLLDKAKFTKAIDEIKKRFDTTLSPDMMAAFKLKRKAWVEQGLNQSIAHEIALLPYLAECLDILDIADKLKMDSAKIASIYFSVGAEFHLDFLRSKVSELPQDTPMKQAAMNSLKDGFYAIQAGLTSKIANMIGKKAIADTSILTLLDNSQLKISPILSQVTAMRAQGSDLAGLMVVQNSMKSILEK
jgi:glutamate dehydrogenase